MYPPRNFNVLISDLSTLSRENAIVATAVEAGLVAGKVTVGGKYKAWDPAATDGSEVVAAVLMQNGEADALIAKVDFAAEVRLSKLIYPPAKKAEMLAGLGALNIKAR